MFNAQCRRNRRRERETTISALFLVAVLAGGRALLLHGVARFAHPVRNVLAEIRYMPCPVIFPVALFAFTLHVTLVRPVRECDTIFEVEDRRTIFCKC